MKKEDKAFSPDIHFPVEQLVGKRILITGAGGTIGFVLTRYLLNLDKQFCLNLKLLLLVRNSERLELEFAEEISESRVKIIVGDIRDFSEIQGEIDYIVHGASITASKMMVEKPVEVIRTNIDGTVNMLELARKKKVKSIVYLSSMEVYGFTEDEVLLTEEKVQYLNPLALRSSYPESKRMCENLCVSYAEEYGVPVKIVRLAQTFGAGVKEEDSRAYAQFARCARDKKDIYLMTDGKSKRMYLDTEDAAIAVLTVLLKGKSGSAYNAGNKATYCSIRKLAELAVKEIGDGSIKIHLKAQDVEKGKYPPAHKLMLDVSKIEALGWEPASGLKEMYAHMMEEWGKIDA
ncbi:Nucleoside-diphosphate-sugar epimerases [[Clostridium] cf. saccharolyticum K10]|nr:Nucleoside-diphosphate-sugar epimerases [[Clostridium] cf. saccharolyticum K10]